MRPVARSTLVSISQKNSIRPTIVFNRSSMDSPISHRTLSTYLVSPSDLSTALQSPCPPIPLCASWFLPNDSQRRTGRAVFAASRIPGARFFDIDAVKDNSSPYPHMLPSSATFAAAMGSLGITREDTVVVYDTKELGIFSAPRVAWTLSRMGHQNVHVLNNYRLWVEAGLPTTSGEPGEPETVRYEDADVQEPAHVVDYECVRNLATGAPTPGLEGALVLDARPRGRFDGTEPEPRPGLPSGHMPGAVSVPFGDVLDPESRAFLPRERLRELFEARGVKPGVPLVSSCGTGVTAVVLDAALAEAGYETQARFVYDGSWTEWAMRSKDVEGLIEKS